MKIGIDARLINETGVGRYIRNLLDELKYQDLKNHYVIYLPEKSFYNFILPSDRWEKRLATARWHTFQEQFIMPILFLKDNLDLLHVPYFNIPIFYPKKFVVTIHDLTILHFMTGKATMLPYFFYTLRRLGYRLLLEFGLRKASAIIVPSQTTKQEIINHFHIPKTRIHVTYEGVDRAIGKRKTPACRQGRENGKRKLMTNPYFLYVGNAYPHKNLEMLVLAFEDFIHSKKDENQYRLVLVGKDDFFYNRLKTVVNNRKLGRNVLFLGQTDDETLRELYTHARALVFPSLMEGFGLPALEALSLGTPVICSDIPIFHEILKNLPYYINPNDRDEISRSFSVVVKKKKNEMKGKRDEIALLLKKYSWKQLGIDTIFLYNSLGNTSTGV
jgi:glycosyltransferase involved in cell wall biosynthesis